MNNVTSTALHIPAPSLTRAESAVMDSWHTSVMRPMDAYLLLDELKQRLLGEVLEVAAEPRSTRRLRLAAERAAAVAAETPFPLLVFPCLFEELCRTATA